MFGSGHPRPPHRKEVAMHVVRQEARRLDSHTLTVDVPDAPKAAPAPDPQPIRFDVVYTLPEYLGFLRDHLAFLLRQAPDGVRLRRTAVPLACAALAAALAWLAGPGALRTTLAACAVLAAASLPAAAGAWVALVGTPVFFVKKRRMPLCAFSIDAHGIERRSRAGTLVRRWEDVRGVRRYRRGYLVLYDHGAMPIPFRCMDSEQEAALRRLLASNTFKDSIL
jgi:hypothetical protein